MTPIQQLFLGQGAKKKVFLDEVFSTYVYKGSGSARSINTNVDMTKGGLVWVKRRDVANRNSLSDSARGVTKAFWTDKNHAQYDYSDGSVISSFNNNGFSIGDSSYVNSNNNTYASWSFRKEPGFFDVVTYTGNAAGRWIPHNLGCKPGLILFKRYDQAENWVVYHRAPGATKYLRLDGSMGTDPAYANNGFFLDTEPTATHFRVGTQTGINGPSYEMVAYLFGGGASGAATASSTEFTGSIYLTVPDASGDLDFQGGDRTIEMWINPDDWGSGDKYLWSSGSQSLSIFKESGGGFKIGKGSANWYTHPELPPVGQWTHIALVRTNNKLYLYFNGTLVKGDISVSSMYGATRYVGTNYNSTSDGFDGKISNLRFTKSAVYTSSFKPPTEPLTNISNTELLFCNSATNEKSYTVSPGTIGSSGGVNPRSDSPFDDPAGFVFGEEGDQKVITTGSYEGSGTAGNNEIFLGFEPQYILIKRTDGTGNWRLFDSMRGIVSDGNDPFLQPNWDSLENTSSEVLELTSTGFRLQTTDSNINGGGYSYAYMAIRRPDPLVQKLAEAGTDVFNLATGRTDSVTPAFTTGFPVDFNLYRPVTTSSWVANTRLLGDKVLYTDSSGSEQSSGGDDFDFNTGMGNWTGDQSAYKSWLWKRHAGFDVVTRLGSSSQTDQSHSLGQVPEMIWAKIRNNNENWAVYHKGLNGGTNPEQYRLTLDNNGAEASSSTAWASKAPTSTHFFVGNDADTNGTNDDYIYMLFSSVDGISKVGSYAGSSSAVTATLGFSPRLIILKNATSTNWWVLHDTMRGLATSSGGTSQGLYPAETTANTATTSIYKTSTGFVLATGGGATYNASGSNYIYYAHV